MDGTTQRASRPLGLLAELTHRCPLGCPYCSNPLALDGRAEELDTATWARVFGEAAAHVVLALAAAGAERHVDTPAEVAKHRAPIAFDA